MEYLVDNKKYSLSYTDLKEKYNLFSKLSLSEFLDRLPEVLHLTCIISYLKEVPSYNTLSDTGLIHELVHLLDITDEPLVDAEKIRQKFINEMKLV